MNRDSASRLLGIQALKNAGKQVAHVKISWLDALLRVPDAKALALS